jgi:GxxExxY protein
MNRQDAKSAEVGGEKIKKREEPDAALDELAYEVIGAAIEVHRHLGPGYLENVYEEALALEFRLRGLPFERQKEVAVEYKEKPVGEGRLDFLVAERLVVELKAVEALAPIHRAQVISYLKSTRLRLGLLINFNVTILKDGLQRIIQS